MLESVIATQRPPLLYREELLDPQLHCYSTQVDLDFV